MIVRPTIHMDTTTLLIVVLLSACIFGFLFLLSGRQHSGERHRPSEHLFTLWGFANLCCGAGCLLFGLFASQGPSLITYVANGLMIGFFSLMWAGLRRFDARPVHWPVVWAIPLAMMLLFAIPVPGVDLVLWHIYGYSLVSGGFCVACFIECWNGQREEPLVMRRLAMAAFMAALVATALRTVIFAWADKTGRDLDWLGPGFALAFLLIFLVWSHSILLMLNERYANRLLRQALNDPLTGVFNRLGFRDAARAEIDRCRRMGRSTWVLLYDLDHFKSVNDTYGHEAGDQLLRAFVATAQQTLRTDDVLGRHGGEEFSVLLADCNAQEAMAAAERLRLAFERVTRLVDGREVRTTVSAGGAEVQHDKDPLRAAIRRADDALYKAKQDRNRVLLSESAVRSQSR